MENKGLVSVHIRFKSSKRSPRWDLGPLSDEASHDNYKQRDGGELALKQNFIVVAYCFQVYSSYCKWTGFLDKPFFKNYYYFLKCLSSSLARVVQWRCHIIRSKSVQISVMPPSSMARPVHLSIRPSLRPSLHPSSILQSFLWILKSS